MKTVVLIAGIVLLAVSVNAGADEVEQKDSPKAATKQKSSQTLTIDDIPPTQVLCMKVQRTGSRVSRNVCQTLAEWKLEIELRALRPAHLIRARGKPASWE